MTPLADMAAAARENTLHWAVEKGPKSAYLARSIIELISTFDASARITVFYIQIDTMFLEKWKINRFGASKKIQKREATEEVYKVLRGVLQN